MTRNKNSIENQKLAKSPLRYCKYAVTNSPAIVTGTKPNTIPDNNGSTIFIYIKFIIREV